MKKVCLDDRCEIKIDSPEDKLDKEINEMMDTDVEKDFDDGFNEKLSTERLSVKYNKNIPNDIPSTEEFGELVQEQIENKDIDDEESPNDDSDTGVTCDDALATLEETSSVMLEMQCAFSKDHEKCVAEAEKILDDFKNGVITSEELGKKMKELVSQ